MNTERLTQLAEWLEAGAPHEVELTNSVRRIVFDMNTGYERVRVTTDVPFDAENPSHNACTTTCCIAGATVQFFNKPDELFDEHFEDENYTGEYEAGAAAYIPWYAVRQEAEDLLGLDREQGHALFLPNEAPPFNDNYDLYFFNDPAWAARTIRHLLKTGEVDWVATSEGGKRRQLRENGYLDRELEEATE